jgi:hypothetical protein
MKTKILKGTVTLAVLAAFGLVCMTGIKAQPAAVRSGSPLMTTNWIGCLVVGKTDSIDQIAHSPCPTAVQQVEIGLRSDGVVIWHNGPAK